MPKVPYESVKEQYVLRSTFFYNNLRSKGYFLLFRQVQAYVASEQEHLDWSQRNSWHISDTAWGNIERCGISPAMVFMHPKMLATCPSFLRYYRNIAMLPIKGITRLTGVSNIEAIEETGRKPSKAQSERLLATINEVISLIVSLASRVNKKELEGMMYSTIGTNIQGSWLNKIGNEGERVIRTILFDGLHANDEISSVTYKDSNTMKVTASNFSSMRDRIEEKQTLNLVNGYSVIFSSEPDVELKDRTGNTVGSIEIKSGLDPAGALERLGAIFKSFENTLDEYPDAVTILVASCNTDESQKRLMASMHVRQIYVTTDITTDESGQRKFVNKVRSLLKLS